MLETENAKINGFPLRQIVTTRTKYDMPRQTKLTRPSSRTMTRETWVTKIQETTTRASAVHDPGLLPPRRPAPAPPQHDGNADVRLRDRSSAYQL